MREAFWLVPIAAFASGILGAWAYLQLNGRPPAAAPAREEPMPPASSPRGRLNGSTHRLHKSTGRFPQTGMPLP